MRSRVLLSLLLLPLWLCSHLTAQENVLLISNDYFFPGLNEFEHEELFGIALNSAEALSVSDYSVGKMSINSYRIDESRSIDLLLESADRSSDPELKQEVYFLIAQKYFERKDYIRSKSYWHKINPYKLDLEQRAVMQFKLGYCYLLNKNFKQADENFSAVADSDHALRMHASYYEGICAFYLDDRERAISSFQKVERDPNYKTLVPFYLSQIYFKDQDYEQAIKYGKSKISNTGAETYLVDRILGLSYIALGDYDNALIHLEKYAQEADSISENDAFQLGSTHYKLGNYSEAQSYFKELSYQNSQIGQMSNFLLASTSIKEGNKKDARSAFKQASKLNFFPDIQEESEFLYYKISAELGDERVAINGLSSISSNHDYYEESQDLLAKLLNNSQDTENALVVIEQLPYKSDKMLQTYQSLSYQRAMQLMNDGDMSEAITHLKDASETNAGSVPEQELNFRLAQAYDSNSDNVNSQAYLTKYLSSKEDEHRFEAYYLMAYQNMDEKDYDKAIINLENSLESFDTETDDKLLFDDVVIRLADLELVNNNYSAALDYYQLAITNNAVDSDYILYQKSMIYGVNNQIIEKLTSLEELLKSYPDSEYRDDALFQVAETLMELNKNNQAYQVYQTIILEHGTKSEFCSVSHMRQGLISYNQGDLYAALNSYKQGIAISRDKEERRRALMAVEDIYLYELNQADEFFKYTESLTGASLDDISRDSIEFSIAVNIYKDAKYEKAVEQFKSYLYKYSDGFYRTDAHYYLGESYLVLKRYGEALNEYKSVINSDQSKFKNSSIQKAAVIAFNHAQDFELSFTLYEQLISEQSGQAQLDQLEAVLFSAFRTERWNSVIKYGELVLMDSNSPQETKASAHYYMAKAFMANNKTEEALEQFKQVASNANNYQSAESSFTIAKIYFDRSELEKAEEQAFHTADKASNYPFWVSKSILLLGDIYSIRKDYLNATAAYESILENFKDRKEIIEAARNKLDALQKKIKEESRIEEPDPNNFIPSDSTGIKK